jgi:hypothetical protein
MNEITVITTYYNNEDLLRKFIENFLLIENIRLIIVDDGSMIHPAIDTVKNFPADRISLYRIKKDLGFNSHGARNLGHTVSVTDWIIFVDIDCNLLDIADDIKKLRYANLNENSVYYFNLNTFLIHKEVYGSCKGYDEEFINIHYGDRFFLEYLKDNFKSVQMTRLIPTRPNKNVIFSSEHEITTYDDEKKIFYQPITDVTNSIENVKAMVKKRYKEHDFFNKHVLNFEWEKLIP